MLNNVYGNYATNNGGGSYLNNSINTTIIGSVYGNSAYCGGGVCLDSSISNTISGSVYNNSADFGGGLYLYSSDYFTNTGWITNNRASVSGGGVYTNTSHPNSYLGVGRVINNIPNNFN